MVHQDHRSRAPSLKRRSELLGSVVPLGPVGDKHLHHALSHGTQLAANTEALAIVDVIKDRYWIDV